MNDTATDTTTMQGDRKGSVLDNAGRVDEMRRSSAASSLYRALLESLPEEEQDWVLEVVARHREAEHEADVRGEPFPGPAW